VPAAVRICTLINIVGPKYAGTRLNKFAEGNLSLRKHTLQSLRSRLDAVHPPCLCGRLIGGMQATAGGIAAAAAERVVALATARQMRIRLAACISSVRGIQGLVSRLRFGRDLLQVEAAGSPKLPPVGGVAEGAHGGAVPQGLGHRRPDGFSADGTVAVKFNEAEDDDELLLRVFKDMDTNGDNAISHEELDKALESWTGSRELVEALQGAVQGAGTGVDLDTFKKMANQVRAREQSQ
jgi:hypothetical protein